MQQMKFEVLTVVNITDCGLLGCGNAQSGERLLLCHRETAASTMQKTI